MLAKTNLLGVLVAGSIAVLAAKLSAQDGAGYRMVGLVSEQGTGQPVAGAAVQVLIESERSRDHRLRTGVSDAMGRYSVELPVGHAWAFGVRPPAGYLAVQPNHHEQFATTAPKLMFLFLPLVAAVALLFYWRPRRLYAEHLVLFLHNHAFAFLLIGASQVLDALSNFKVPFIGLLGFVNFLLYLYLFWYVYKSMRVVYGEGRFKTVLKYFVIGTVYFVLLAITMLAGVVYTAIGLV